MPFRKSTAFPGTGQLFTQIPQRIHLSGSMYGFFWKIFRALASFVQTLFRTFVRSTLKLGLPYFSIKASIEITLQTTSIPICFLSTETFAFWRCFSRPVISLPSSRTADAEGFSSTTTTSIFSSLQFPSPIFSPW